VRTRVGLWFLLSIAEGTGPPMVANKLLAHLSRAEFANLQPSFQSVELTLGLIIYEAGAEIEYTFFPLRGSLSVVVVTLDGRMIEVATVGNEGATGLPKPLAPEKSPNRVFVQMTGEALRIGTRALANELQRSLALQDVLTKYQAAYQIQVTQSVACNGLHSLRERCCRWLLMAHDRAHSDAVELTHEFLAIMLGVRRPSVSEILQQLKESGLLTYNRGTITIVDRTGLEQQSCECYRVVTSEYAKLLG
jgi:CRP-like cAMP-binding protein